MIPHSQTILYAIYSFMNTYLYYSITINSNSAQQDKLKDAFRFFKTLASHLPELVCQRNYLPNLSAIHSDEHPFLKKFTRSELEKMPADQLANYINALYETASEGLEDRSLLEEAVNKVVLNTSPSLLDRFKSFSPQIRLLIVLVVIVAVAIAASLLLFYFLSHKEAGSQVVV
ncbi:hypothetical protein ENBRE01_3089 [Enteropsectra breve]|nr:hypothetical protein ENBRE01_3089 [Enteropsectra breve]KAI5181728.1 hypothetical protein NEOKW01_1892 [Nematocida sp. AWRm80]